MKGKDGGWDLSDLEHEIDSAVDTLLVKKGEKANPGTQPQTNQPQTNQPQTNQPQTNQPQTNQPQTNQPSLKETDIPERPFSPPPQSPPLSSPAHTTEPVSRDLEEKLEAVEAQLLTLEWDISSKHLNNAITHLQDLRKLSHVGDELEKVIILIQKVLYQLNQDESKLTPAALKFLQKSWKAVKGMTDERFSSEIDKGTLIRELIAEFQGLRIEETPKKMVERAEVRQPPRERVAIREDRVTEEPSATPPVPFAELDKFMNKIEQLLRVVNDERKRLEGIHQEIVTFKDDLQNALNSGIDLQRIPHKEGIPELDERLSRKPYRQSDLELADAVRTPIVRVFLFKVSGIIFAFPEQQIIRSFPIKKWVSEFFIERGKVKLKTREIPLFNICQVFKLRPSIQENPLVLLIRGREDRPAAVIIDQAISREEIEYKPIEGKPYILGQGKTKSGTVWILHAEQISP
jgi:chemotaxis protein histidine kinase CheA